MENTIELSGSVSTSQTFIEENAQQESQLALPAVLCDDELLQEINSIPQKLAFKIGDVAEMLDIKQYVLRYWESEFDELRPQKSKTNQRVYSRKDVETAYLIRKLLYRDRFSIEGARSALRTLKTHVRKEKKWTGMQMDVQKVKGEIEELMKDIRGLKALFKSPEHV